MKFSSRNISLSGCLAFISFHLGSIIAIRSSLLEYKYNTWLQQTLTQKNWFQFVSQFKSFGGCSLEGWSKKSLERPRANSMGRMVRSVLTCRWVSTESNMYLPMQNALFSLAYHCSLWIHETKLYTQLNWCKFAAVGGVFVSYLLFAKLSSTRKQALKGWKAGWICAIREPAENLDPYGCQDEASGSQSLAHMDVWGWEAHSNGM